MSVLGTVAAAHRGGSIAAKTHGKRAGAGFWALTLGSVGVVYGDIGTSPLYAMRESVLAAVGAGNPANETAIFGILSLIIWALILIVTLKYVVILLRADNNGEGGTLALMALAQRSLAKRAGAIVLCGVISAALFYGDAMITPALSVLSAIEGLKVATPAFDHYVVALTALILVVLFAFQSHGTAMVAASIRAMGSRFSPATGSSGWSRWGRCFWWSPARKRSTPISDISGVGRSKPLGSALWCPRSPSTISARARWCWRIPRASRIRSSCFIPTGRCCRWWFWPPRRP